LAKSPHQTHQPDFVRQHKPLLTPANLKPPLNGPIADIYYDWTKEAAGACGGREEMMANCQSPSDLALSRTISAVLSSAQELEAMPQSALFNSSEMDSGGALLALLWLRHATD
jgi:hypothetical protein